MLVGRIMVLSMASAVIPFPQRFHQSCVPCAGGSATAGSALSKGRAQPLGGHTTNTSAARFVVFRRRWLDLNHPTGAQVL